MSKFGDAFASARKAGKKVFSFNGKSYNTKTKEEAAAPVPKSRPKKGPVKGLKLPSTAQANASAASSKLKGPVPKKKGQKKGHGIAMGKYRLK